MRLGRVRSMVSNYLRTAAVELWEAVTDAHGQRQAMREFRAWSRLFGVWPGWSGVWPWRRRR